MDSNQRLPPCQGDTLPTELRGQKRKGSISKKSLNSKQILTFRKIPPKFYHLTLAEILYKISPRRKIPVEILREISPSCRNPARNFIPLLKFESRVKFIALVRYSRVSPQQPILLRFVLSSRFASTPPRFIYSPCLALSYFARLPRFALHLLRCPNFFIQL